MSKYPILERGERMLYGRASQPHHLRSRSLLHALERAFVQMARHQTLRAISAVQLQRTGAADVRLGCVVDSTIFARQLFACQCLVGRTAEGVCLLVIMKLAAVEQRTVSLIVDAACHRH